MFSLRKLLPYSVLSAAIAPGSPLSSARAGVALAACGLVAGRVVAQPRGNVAPIAPVQVPQVLIPQVLIPPPVQVPRALTAPSTIAAIPSLAVPSMIAVGDALGWEPGADRCVTALAQEPNGLLWVATEDQGVWRCDPSSPPSTGWKQFKAKDGLGDDSAYALCVDRQGRVWAGTLNHGVSVWNGQGWKNYGVLDGPLGERVFSIKVCPTDGDVWIATNAGLTRYSSKNDTWRDVPLSNDLASAQVQAIGFDKEGNVIVGTQCDGVALAQAADGYKTWRQVKGPEQLPTAPTGQGLPSSLINDVLVARDGTIYAATTAGLAWSRDKGSTWSFVRGQDYADKVKGRYGGLPTDWKQASGAVLAEDYVSCLSEDDRGRIWLGHWRLGNEALQMQLSATGALFPVFSVRAATGFVKALLPQGSAAPLVARYDEGLAYGDSLNHPPRKEDRPEAPLQNSDGKGSRFPAPAKAPTLGELNALLASLRQIEPLDPKEVFVAPLPDDWTTQGDWLGRYGRYWAS